MTGSADQTSARIDALHERVGALYLDDTLWGYLRVRRDALHDGPFWHRKRSKRAALWQDFYRVLPPQPTDPDRADSLGLSDSFVRPEHLAEELDRLERDELLMTGRALRIVWQSGSEADEIRRRCFSESRFPPQGGTEPRA